MRILRTLSLTGIVLLAGTSYAMAGEDGAQYRRLMYEKCDPANNLLCAIGKHNNEAVKALLGGGASAVNLAAFPDSDGSWPPLDVAIKYNNFSAAELLISHGANVNGEGPHRENSFTPLEYAAQQGDLGITQLLLAHGADPNKRRNADEYTALMLAVDGPDGTGDEAPRSSDIQSQIIDALINAGADINAESGGQSALFRAVFAADFDMVSHLTSMGAKPPCIKGEANSPTLIGLSVMSGSVKMVQEIAGMAKFLCVGDTQSGIATIEYEADYAKHFKDGYKEKLQDLAKMRTIVSKMKPGKS